jgi:hypothetical protein
MPNGGQSVTHPGGSVGPGVTVGAIGVPYSLPVRAGRA